MNNEPKHRCIQYFQGRYNKNCLRENQLLHMSELYELYRNIINSVKGLL